MNASTRYPAGRRHLFVIGAQKAGTTWLQHVLDCDPRFSLPAMQELHFFDHFLPQGRQMAQDYLKNFPNATDDRITVEVTPNYLNRTDLIGVLDDCISEHRLDARFVVLLREPVARAFSDYQMQINRGRFETDFETALENRPEIFKKGCYAEHLQHWFGAFGRPAFCILFHDDVQRSPDTVLSELADFLRLHDPIHNAYSDTVINAGGVDRIAALTRVRALSGKLLRSLGFAGLVHRLKRSASVQWAEKVNKTRLTLDPEIHMAILEKYRPEVDRLDELIGLGQRRDSWGYAPRDMIDLTAPRDWNER